MNKSELNKLVKTAQSVAMFCKNPGIIAINPQGVFLVEDMFLEMFSGYEKRATYNTSWKDVRLSAVIDGVEFYAYAEEDELK